MARRLVDHTDAPVVGYTDRLSVRPGQRLSVSASSTEPDVRVRVLRIDHDGQSPVRTPVEAGTPDRIQVPHQHLDLGSYGILASLPGGPAVTYAAWVWPTAWPAGRAMVLSQGAPDGDAFTALWIGADGRAAFTAGAGSGPVSAVGDRPLRLRRWYLLVGGYDPEHGARLVIRPGAPLAGEEAMAVATGAGGGTAAAGGGTAAVGGATAADLVLAARRDAAGVVTDHFDGKIDQPCVFDRLLTGAEIADLAGAAAGALRLGATGCWDLARDIDSDRVSDLVADRRGRLHNLPLRGVTGHDWTGEVLDWRFATHGYGAAHFHSDDLVDSGWEPVLTLQLPADLPGGCYAVELASTAGVDRVPFFVRPPAGAEPAPLALLVPTLSYLAYALEHCRAPFGPEDPTEVAAAFARANTLHSLYDRHTDGSGVATASVLRPLLGVRDDHAFRYTRSPHQYSEDVALVGWLNRQGLRFDVLTDHDLDAEGVAALAGYRAVVTGSHPEYWTGAMLDAAGAYLHGGGRVGYLGGNGAYWVTAVAGDRRHVAELRRGYSGVRTWECEPGELHLASTGEPGGLWAERGRSAHRLFGIGSTAAGMTQGGAYQVLAKPGDPLAERVFAGVDRDTPLGGYGSVLGAAASFETDGVDPLLGSPPDVRLLGRAMLGDLYNSADTGPAFPHPLGDPVDRRRADLTLLDTPGGGAVFATGSIGWCGALSEHGDDNGVSRVTANVLRWFCRDRGET